MNLAAVVLGLAGTLVLARFLRSSTWTGERLNPWLSAGATVLMAPACKARRFRVKVQGRTVGRHV